MTSAAALAVELDLDRLEAALLDGDASVLTTPLVDQLAARALATDDAALHVRARVLLRLSLAARLASHPAISATSSLPHDLAGLAARHLALHTATRALGFTSTATLLTSLHGPCAAPETETETDAGVGGGGGRGAEVGAAELATAPLPDATQLIAAIVARHELVHGRMELRGGSSSGTVTIAPGHARAVVGAGGDALATLALTLHEAGHAMYRAQQHGMSFLAAAPPARWFDEAIAAWAVRALEDPAYVADATVRAEARRRRLRREHVTRRLAELEAAVLAALDASGALIEADRTAAAADRTTAEAGRVAVDDAMARALAIVRDAWARTGLLDPAAYPALFDEPGVMASYVAADRAHLDPAPGELRRWARRGAALELTPWIATKR